MFFGRKSERDKQDISYRFLPNRSVGSKGLANELPPVRFIPRCSPPTEQEGQERLWKLLGSVPLVKYGPRPKDRRLRKLLQDAGGSGEGRDDGGNVEAKEKRGGSKATSAKGSYISFWKPEVSN